jgi:polysaccharide export outer membrane protein
MNMVQTVLIRWSLAISATVLVFMGCTPIRGMRTVRAATPPVDPLPCRQQSYRLFPGDVIELFCYLSDDPVEHYRIQRGDVLDIRFPSMPDYSIQQPVKPDGMIDLPRIGSFDIADLTLDQARELITARYSEIDWYPEFFVVILEYDVYAEKIKDAIMNGASTVGRRATVRPDGFISLPAAGEMPVVGKTVSQLAGIVRERYAERYSRLRFAVQLTEAHTERYYVFGNVVRPGGHTLSQSRSLVELIATAGGPTRSADMRHVYVMMVADDTVHVSSVDFNTIVRGHGPDRTLCPGTVVYVPEHPIYTVAEFSRLLSQITLFRGLGLGASINLQELFQKEESTRNETDPWP